jgi:AraC-like DNA-binding protein
MTMEPAVDRVIELRDEELSVLLSTETELAARLDNYFMARKVRPKRTFSTIIDMVYRCGGQVSVEELSLACHVSNRTMERLFKEHVGIPPKEFMRIVRFQEVLKRLRQAGKVSEESLLRVAFELGYYDHAHLTNEFKKYAGILPSELSLFYKTGIAGGQYF